jgi:rhodanese-related sulfurtransferase
MTAKRKDEIKIVLAKGTLVKFLIFSALILFGYFLGGGKNLNVADMIGRGATVTAAETISAAQLKEKLENKDFYLVNVHIPYEGEIELTDFFVEYDGIVAANVLLPEDKSAEIILYCKTGNMSAKALNTLKSLGYTNVRHLAGGMDAWEKTGGKILDLSNLVNDLLPAEGYTLPIKWGSIGPTLVDLGVIDKAKFMEVVAMDDVQKAILEGKSDTNININAGNSQFVVNMLWALGLAQESLVYIEGPMGKEYKDQAGNFASTGGWSLARGNAVDHLGKHAIIPLTADEHKRVMEIAGNVYRPCCGNHTAFPDCNHGMAALAAIELMVSLGLSDEEIYKNVLALNLFWFPTSYITTATYFERQGMTWSDADPKVILGSDYSSGQGSADIARKLGPLPYEGQQGGGCGV